MSIKHINSKFWKSAKISQESDYKLDPKNGNIWYSGSWSEGVWLNGIWDSGLWMGGLWCDGEWIHGTWIAGVWLNGVWHKGGIANFNNPSGFGIEFSPKTYKKPKITLSLNYANYK